MELVEPNQLDVVAGHTALVFVNERNEDSVQLHTVKVLAAFALGSALRRSEGISVGAFCSAESLRVLQTFV